MANEGRTPTHPLALAEALFEALAHEPYRFDFFETLRRLECLQPELERKDGKPSAPARLGRSLRPLDDPIRLGQQPTLGFAAASVAKLDRGDEERPPRLDVLCFGLLGPNGPLPIHLTEYALERLRERDPTFARFLDVFHHRMLSLFYRAWADTQPTVSFDRPASDRFAIYLGALFGLGMPALRNQDAVPDFAKLYYAGQLSGQTRHAEGLQAILSDFFGLPVVVEQFIAHWMELPEDCRCRLGESTVTGILGVSAVIGERVWDCQHKFRITIGPLSLEDYQRFLPRPDGRALEQLVALVRNYIGHEVDWDLCLILRKDQTRVDAKRTPALIALGRGSGRLGWTMWLTDKSLAVDADDLKLDPSAYADERLH
jgi:type VI secretion system protein ImpH